jgi:hypothetical protein
MRQELLPSSSHTRKLIQAHSYCASKNLIRDIQSERGEKDCFMTDERFLCHEVNCEWYDDCKRLVAEWLR